MIENYYYSIPKWKKIVFVTGIGLILYMLLTTHVSSGLLSWFTKKATDNITNEIFDALNETLGEVFGEILGAIGDILTAPWGPQLGTFIAQTNFAGVSADLILENFSIWIGMIVSTLIWGFGMFTFFFSGKITDSKDTPLSLTVRYIIAIAISYKSRVIIDTFLDIIDMIYSGYVLHAISMASGNFAVQIAGLIEQWIKGVFTVLIASPIPGALFILMIFEILITFKVLKGFFKLWAEMISRYIISVVLLLFFAAFGGTIVSNNSTQIFKSYLRTLFSSFLVMLLNMTWFKLCILVALGARVEMSPLQYFFLLELLHFGLKLDGILRSMGLGVASGGARIASAAQGAGRNMMHALHGANQMRKAGGNLLKSGGALLAAKGGNTALADRIFKAGSVIGATGSDIVSGMANPNNSIFNTAAMLGSQGKKIADDNISAGEAANIMSRAMKNPNDKDAQNAIKALSNNKLKEGAQAMLGSDYKVNSASLASVKGADGQKHSAVRINATETGGNTMAGQQAAQFKPFDATISGEGAFKNGETIATGANGEKFDMQKDDIRNSMNKGDSCAASKLEENGGTVAKEALDSAQGLNFDQGEIESMGRNADGEDSFRAFDSDGNMSGTIQGDSFIANSANDTDAQQKALDNMKQGIESMGYKCSDFEPVTGKDGEFKATATDADGNKKQFTATDRGVYTDSKLNNDLSSFRYSGTDGMGNNTSFDVNAATAKDFGAKGGGISSNSRFGKDSELRSGNTGGGTPPLPSGGVDDLTGGNPVSSGTTRGKEIHGDGQNPFDDSRLKPTGNGKEGGSEFFDSSSSLNENRGGVDPVETTISGGTQGGYTEVPDTELSIENGDVGQHGYTESPNIETPFVSGGMQGDYMGVPGIEPSAGNGGDVPEGYAESPSAEIFSRGCSTSERYEESPAAETSVDGGDEPRGYADLPSFETPFGSDSTPDRYEESSATGTSVGGSYESGRYAESTNAEPPLGSDSIPERYEETPAVETSVGNGGNGPDGYTDFRSKETSFGSDDKQDRYTEEPVTEVAVSSGNSTTDRYSESPAAEASVSDYNIKNTYGEPAGTDGTEIKETFVETKSDYNSAGDYKPSYQENQGYYDRHEHSKAFDFDNYTKEADEQDDIEKIKGEKIKEPQKTAGGITQRKKKKTK